MFFKAPKYLQQKVTAWMCRDILSNQLGIAMQKTQLPTRWAFRADRQSYNPDKWPYKWFSMELSHPYKWNYYIRAPTYDWLV